MSNPYADLDQQMKGLQRLSIERVNLVLAKYDLQRMTDREEDTLNRAWMDFRAQAKDILRRRIDNERR